jgi:hypothetical protein
LSRGLERGFAGIRRFCYTAWFACLGQGSSVRQGRRITD